MKKLLFLLVLAAFIFYGAWPAYSLYQISQGVRTPDESKLETNIAWVPLRQSLRAPVTERVRREISTQSKGRGIEGAIAGELGKSVAPQMVEQILDAYVTPKGLIALAKTGGKIDIAGLGIGNVVQKLGGKGGANNKSGGIGDLLEAAKELVGAIPGGEELVSSTLSKYGKDLKGLVAKESETTEKSSNEKPSYGIENIKSFRMLSPTSFEIGVAKSPTAKEADLVAGMSFLDNTWKLDKLIPKL